MVPNRVTAVLACLVVCLASAPPVLADPESDGSSSEAGSYVTAADPIPAPPPDDALIPSAEPATTTTPDGWTLTLSSENETLRPVPPLTTATSSRDYIAGGIFRAKLAGEGEPRGVLEVGYQIGCGIDMGTSNGVTLAGSAGASPTLGLAIPLPTDMMQASIPTQLLPAMTTPANGVVTVGLKPGIVNIIPVDKKEFKGTEPWVMISNFHVKIDGCVGQSFIRSYMTLTHQTEQSDSVLSWLGTTKTV